MTQLGQSAATDLRNGAYLVSEPAAPMYVRSAVTVIRLAVALVVLAVQGVNLHRARGR